MTDQKLIDAALTLASRGVQINDGHTYEVPAHDLVEYSETIRALVEALRIPETARQIADEEVEGYAAYLPTDLRWQDLSQSIHTVARRAFLAGEIAAEGKLRPQLAELVAARRDLIDSLSHVDEATDVRTVALRVLARLQGDPSWESVEYDDGEESIDPEMVP